MKYPAQSRLAILFLTSLLVLAACGSEQSEAPAAPAAQAAPEPATAEAAPAGSSGDEQLQARVESALANAADLPPGFVVAVDQGAVLISGSMECEDCGGMRTPGNVGTIQQSLGAVVRAVPGVDRVDFSLDYGN